VPERRDFFQFVPRWAIDAQKLQSDADDWATQKRGVIADQWADLARKEFTLALLKAGYTADGTPIPRDPPAVPAPPRSIEPPGVEITGRESFVTPQQSDPGGGFQGGFDPSQRQIAEPGVVQGLPPERGLGESALGVGASVLSGLQAPAQALGAGIPVPGQDSGESPGAKIARQGLAGSNEGFDRSLEQNVATDPTGGLVSGAVNSAVRLGMDPLNLVGGLAGMGGKVGLGLIGAGAGAGAGYSAATGANARDTAENIGTGATIGSVATIASPALVGLARRVLAHLTPAEVRQAVSSVEAFKQIAGPEAAALTEGDLAQVREAIPSITTTRPGEIAADLPATTPDMPTSPALPEPPVLHTPANDMPTGSTPETPRIDVPGPPDGVKFGDETGPGMGVDETPDAPVFYSLLRRTLDEKMPATATGKSVQKLLADAGVKVEERQWTGIDEFLRPRLGQKVTRDEILAHLDDNEITVTELDSSHVPPVPWQERHGEFFTNGSRDTGAPRMNVRQQVNGWMLEVDGSFHRNPNTWEGGQFYPTREAAMAEGAVVHARMGRPTTQYDTYQLSGPKTGYGELVLTLPDRSEAAKLRAEAAKRGYPDSLRDWPDQEFANRYRRVVLAGQGEGTYRHQHWPDVVNPFAHVRYNGRVDADGRRVLHIEEVQSDMHQAGRKFGYTPEAEARLAKLDAELKSAPEFDAAKQLEYQRLQANLKKAVPDAPFKNTWVDLAWKRMVRYASDNGYDRITWTTGAQQIDRYIDNATPEQAERIRRGMPAFYDPLPAGQDKGGLNLPRTADKVGREFGASTSAAPNDPRFADLDFPEMDGLRPTGRMVPGQGQPVSDTGASRLRRAGERTANYTGPEMTLAELQTVSDRISRGEISLHASDKQYLLDQLKNINGAMANGDSSKKAISLYGSDHLATILGYRIDRAASDAAVHSFDIPEAMSRAARKEGFKLFASPHTVGGAAGAFAADQTTEPQRPDESDSDYALRRAGRLATGAGAGALLAHQATNPAARAALRNAAASTRLNAVAGGGSPLTPAERAQGETALRKITASQSARATGPAPTAPIYEHLGLVPTLRRKFVRLVTDRTTDWSQFEQVARDILKRDLRDDERITIQGYRNPYMATKVLLDDEYKPLVRAIADAGLEEPVNAYLTAMHNVDVAAVHEARKAGTGAVRAFSGDVDEADSALVLRLLEENLGPAEHQKVTAFADQVVKFNQRQLNLDVQAGLTSQAQAAEWMDIYPHYARVVVTPYLEGWRAERSAVQASGKNLNVPGSPTHALSVEGTAQARETPLVASFRDAYESEELRQVNRRFLAFHNLREQSPLMAQAFPEVNPQTPGALTKANKAGTVFSGYVDGVKTYYTAPSKEAADAIGIAGSNRLTGVLGWMASSIQWFKDMVTTHDPGFALAGNVSADLFDATLRGSIREGGPENIPKVWAFLLTNYADAMRGIMQGEFKGRTAEFLRQGGGMSGYFERAPVKVGAEYDRLKSPGTFEVNNSADLKRVLSMLLVPQGKIQAAGTAGGAAFGALQGDEETTPGERVLGAARGAALGLAATKASRVVRPIGERLELGTRVGMSHLASGEPLGTGPVSSRIKGQGLTRSTFRPTTVGSVQTGHQTTTTVTRGKKQTLWTPTTPGQAMQAGRTGTIDFHMGGEWTKQATQLVAFLNPAVQALAAIPRSYHENPAGFVKTMAALIPLYLLEQAWNHRDEATSEIADDTSSSILARGLNFVLPGETENARGQPDQHRILIPIRTYGPVLALVRQIGDRAQGRDPQTWTRLGQSIFQQASPITETSQVGFPGASTVAQLRTGEAGWDQFAHRPIVTQRADESASPLSRMLSQGINAGAAQAGIYPDVRPSQVEFATRDVAGTIAKQAHGGSQILESLRTGKGPASTSPQDIPLAGGVLGRFVRREGGERLQQARESAVTPEHRAMLYDAGLRPDASAVPGDINGAPLTREEQTSFQERANILLERRLSSVARTSAFRQGSLSARKTLVNEAIAAAHTEARERIVSRIGERALARRRSDQIARRDALGVR
jgi:hypothetical protein